MLIYNNLDTETTTVIRLVIEGSNLGLVLEGATLVF
jgi:hypothetical protein